MSQLQNCLALCPTAILILCQLAIVLEGSVPHEEALLNWKAVLASDHNNLMARESVARCRRRIGRPLQPM